MRDHCEVCEQDYVTEYNQLMKEIEDQNKPKRRKRTVCHRYNAGICRNGSDCVNIHEAPDLRVHLREKIRKFQ